MLSALLRFTLMRLVQPQQHSSSIFLTLLRSRLVRLEQFLNANLSIDVTLAADVTVVNPVQPEKAAYPIDVTLLRLIAVMVLQPLNAESPTEVHLLRSTFLSDSAPLKALPATLVTFPRLIFSSLVHL